MFVVFFFVVSFLVVGAACAPITASPWRRRINQSVKQETELRVVLVATPGCARLLAHPDVAPAALTIQLKAWRRYSRCL